jgi:hypothetical protein
MVSPQRTLRYPYNKVQGPPIIVGSVPHNTIMAMNNVMNFQQHVFWKMTLIK